MAAPQAIQGDDGRHDEKVFGGILQESTVRKFVLEVATGQPRLFNARMCPPSTLIERCCVAFHVCKLTMHPKKHLWFSL